MCSLGNLVPTTVQAEVPTKYLYHLGLCIRDYCPLLPQILWLEWVTQSCLSCKGQCKWSVEDQQLSLSYTMRPWAPTSQELWFLFSLWVQTVTLESSGVLLSMWKDRSVSLEPQAVLTHSPGHADTVQPVTGVISPVTCYLTFVCHDRFWHKDSERKLCKVLCGLKCFSLCW